MTAKISVTHSDCFEEILFEERESFINFAKNNNDIECIEFIGADYTIGQEPLFQKKLFEVKNLGLLTFKNILQMPKVFKIPNTARQVNVYNCGLKGTQVEYMPKYNFLNFYKCAPNEINFESNKKSVYFESFLNFSNCDMYDKQIISFGCGKKIGFRSCYDMSGVYDLSGFENCEFNDIKNMSNIEKIILKNIPTEQDLINSGLQNFPRSKIFVNDAPLPEKTKVSELELAYKKIKSLELEIMQLKNSIKK